MKTSRLKHVVTKTTISFSSFGLHSRYSFSFWCPKHYSLWFLTLGSPTCIGGSDQSLLGPSLPFPEVALGLGHPDPGIQTPASFWCSSCLLLISGWSREIQAPRQRLDILFLTYPLGKGIGPYLGRPGRLRGIRSSLDLKEKLSDPGGHITDGSRLRERCHRPWGWLYLRRGNPVPLGRVVYGKNSYQPGKSSALLLNVSFLGQLLAPHILL